MCRPVVLQDGLPVSFPAPTHLGFELYLGLGIPTGTETLLVGIPTRKASVLVITHSWSMRKIYIYNYIYTGSTYIHTYIHTYRHQYTYIYICTSTCGCSTRKLDAIVTLAHSFFFLQSGSECAGGYGSACFISGNKFVFHAEKAGSGPKDEKKKLRKKKKAQGKQKASKAKTNEEKVKK